MTPEGKVVDAIRKAVKAAGGEARKCKWVGRRGCPDWFVMVDGYNWFIEAKAPGKTPEPHQTREHGRMRDIGGCIVWVADDVLYVTEAIEAVAKGCSPFVAGNAWGLNK